MLGEPGMRYAYPSQRPQDWLSQRWVMLRGRRVDLADVAWLAAFYEHTTEHDLDVWSEWCGAFRPFAVLIHLLYSRRMQQLNLPTTTLPDGRRCAKIVFPLPRGNATVVLAPRVDADGALHLESSGRGFGARLLLPAA